MSYFITKRRIWRKKVSHPSDSPLPPRGHRPPPSGRADAGGAHSAQRGRSRRGRAGAPRTCRRRHRQCCRWIGSSCPPHGKGRCPPIGSLRSPLPPASGGSCYAVIQSLPRYHGERSTSANHTSLSLVFLGRFPIRPVTQSASSCGLASWTGSARGAARAVEGVQNRGCDTKFVTSSTAPALHRFSENHGSAMPQIFALASDASSVLCM